MQAQSNPSTTQETPFETLLPRLSAYEKALNEDNRMFSQGFCSHFDQSKWEDRFLMFIFIARNCRLENDTRLPFHKYIERIVRVIDDNVMDQVNPSTMSDLDWECLLEEIVYELPIEFKKSDFQEEINAITELMKDWIVGDSDCQSKVKYAFLGLYGKHYPNSMIKKTSLGEFVWQVAENIYLDNRIHALAQSVGNSLIFMIEQLTAKINQVTSDGEELFLHKGDIDWKELAILRLKMDDLEWYYRNYEDTNVLSDWFSTPYEDQEWNYGSFMIDLVLFRIFKAFGVDPTEYTKELKSYYYDMWACHTQYHTDEYWGYEIEDFYTECIPYWIKHNGDTLFPNGK